VTSLRRPGRHRTLPLLALVAALSLAACGETPGDVLPDPRDGRSGLRLTGQVGGRQIALSDGLPVLNTTDCDVAAGPDRDVCFVTRDISGESIIVIIENPDALAEGETLPVEAAPCRDRLDCDEVEGVAVVDVQIGLGADRIRATGGTLAIDVLVPGSRYRGSLDLRLPGGDRLRGEFDVVPRPEEIS
jgi:hypothetical protein